ncbi:hypothetical protein ACLKA6_001814 [Drosophila palustris]
MADLSFNPFPTVASREGKESKRRAHMRAI